MTDKADVTFCIFFVLLGCSKSMHELSADMCETYNPIIEMRLDEFFNDKKEEQVTPILVMNGTYGSLPVNQQYDEIINAYFDNISQQKEITILYHGDTNNKNCILYNRMAREFALKYNNQLAKSLINP